MSKFIKSNQLDKYFEKEENDFSFKRKIKIKKFKEPKDLKNKSFKKY